MPGHTQKYDEACAFVCLGMPGLGGRGMEVRGMRHDIKRPRKGNGTNQAAAKTLGLYSCVYPLGNDPPEYGAVAKTAGLYSCVYPLGNDHPK